MSNSKLNVAAASVFGGAKHVHYAVSTFAAVLYAVVWLLTGRAEAEMANIPVRAQEEAIPEFVITAQREPAADGLQEIVVWGNRESSESLAAIDEIVVWGTREETVASSSNGSGPSGSYAANVKSGGNWTTKVRQWVRSVLM